MWYLGNWSKIQPSKCRVYQTHLRKRTIPKHDFIIMNDSLLKYFRNLSTLYYYITSLMKSNHSISTNLLTCWIVNQIHLTSQSQTLISCLLVSVPCYIQCYRWMEKVLQLPFHLHSHSPHCDTASHPLCHWQLRCVPAQRCDQFAVQILCLWTAATATQLHLHTQRVYSR